MRPKWIALGFAAFLIGAALNAQQDPAHPFPNHEMPPDTWFCVPTDTADRMQHEAHACDCLGMTSDPMCTTMGQDADGNDVEMPQTNDNAKCKVYCHKDHCLCRKQCDDN
jgi:hypothetical protein